MILLEALFWKNSANDLRHTLKLEEGECGKKYIMSHIIRGRPQRDRLRHRKGFVVRILFLD